MKKTLIFALLSGSFFSALAQHHAAIKIYQNTDHFSTVVTEWWKNQTNEVDHVNFSRISVALTVKRKVVHEIEFFIPEMSKSPDRLRFPMNYEFRKDPRWASNASAYAFRYEISKSISSDRSPLKVAIGAALHPYYVSIEHTPVIDLIYPSSARWYGASLNLIPRLTYTISERFFLDLNIPVKAFDYRFHKEQVNNPAIPVRQQVNQYAESIFFEGAYTIRFGVGYCFGGSHR